MPSLQPHFLRPKYRPDIDGLRAIAVLSVVAFHAFPGRMPGGFIGVDIFFVISGFLISTIIFQNLDKGIFSFAEFYARRVKRIFPALILVLAVSYAFGWFALLPDEYKQLSKHIAAAAGFASNFQLWSEAGYFDNSAYVKPLLHLWSLGIEEQFYIIWPFLLWLARKSVFRLLLATILIATSFYMNVSQIQTDPVATFYFPQTRFWELLCGSLLAWLTLYKQGASIRIGIGSELGALIYGKLLEYDGKVLNNILSFAGLLLLIYGFCRLNKELSFPGQWAIVPTLGAVLIIAAGPEAWLNRNALSHRLAVWFGLISFPLYLWHWPLLSFAWIIGSEFPSITSRIGAVVASVALAWLTYKHVEGPVRLDRHSSKAKTAVLMVLLSLVGYVGYTTHLKDGLGFRQSATLKDFDGDIGQHEYYKYITEHYHICTPASIADAAPRWEGFIRCIQSKTGSEVDIAIVGDSHAEHLFLGIADAMPTRNVAVYVKTAPAFLWKPEFRNIFKYVIESESIKHVILTMYWKSYLPEVPEGSSLDKEISLVIDALTKAGKTIYLTDDIPAFPFTANACKRYRWFGWKNIKCEVGAKSEIQQYERYIVALTKMTQDRVDVKMLSTRRYFCDIVVCSMVKENKILYRDYNHLNINGSFFVGRKIVEDNAGIFD